ncbi:glycosyltransferase family 39 protein, partial [Enterococcus faecalis]|uniref:glycosyltransferase family 39 protein n=1 Tax=Enterococcus faecalis TaxID=1351 RepID=UPI00403FB9FF
TPVALAFCAAILLNAKLAQRLSPSAHQAPFFAALTTAVAPVYMVTGHLFAMNGLDVVLTAALIYCWELTSDDPRWWLALGGVFGIELL